MEKSFKVRERSTNRCFDCIFQCVDLNYDGNIVPRFNIGIMNYQGFNFIHAIYDMKKFTEEYEILEEVI